MTNQSETMLALLTSAELPAIDRHMEETGTSGYVLMERAGAAVAREVATFAPDAKRIVVVSGPNNNGGDCICAARIMREAGRDVTLALFAEPSQLPPDPAKAFSTWSGPRVFASPAALEGADLIIDGLYGGGVKHDITGDAAAIVAAINASPAKVLSVDFPTGISGVSGAVLGTAVKADRTISFFCYKPGHLLMPGRMHCGPIVIDSIGIPASVMDTVKPRAFHNRPALWSVALNRSKQGVERQRIAVILVSGTDGSLVTAGARAAGVGAAADPDDAGAVVCPDGIRMEPDVTSVLARAVPVILGCQRSLVSPSELERLFSCIRARTSPTVLVLDEAGFTRHFPDVVPGSRLEQVREAAAISGAVVALLGMDRIVAAPDRYAAIANNASPGSLIAGAEDVLTGTIGAFAARGMPAFAAAAAAVWLLGSAAGSAEAVSGVESLVIRLGISLRELEAAPPKTG